MCAAKMKINKKLLPIKLHYFFFMAALGPILPQLPLIGKDLGISPIVMGTVTGILPLTFLLTKPLFGMLMDVYRECRKTTFLLLIFIMTLCFDAIQFVPARELTKINFNFVNYTFLESCEENVISVICNSSCLTKPLVLTASIVKNNTFTVCSASNISMEKTSKCFFYCIEDSSVENFQLYRSFTFWSFIVCMSLGTIGFNVINSISDAICFDIVEDKNSYGEQRLWGSVGFGISGLISGYAVDIFSKNYSNYLPAFLTMAVCSFLDLLVCLKLELPIIEAPKNILQDLKIVFSNKHVIVFIIFTVLAGTLDGLLVYFLFWYLEDLAVQTHTTEIKLIEGLILAAETLGAEVLFFSFSGKILKGLGHVNSFTICFFNYALRLGLISVVPSPWWILPIELFMQGPTFALTYTAIVAYANELAPAGMSATMQGIAAGMGDGTGYAVGSIVGGFFYHYLGGKVTFQIFTWVALLCGVLHFLIHVDDNASNRRASYEEID